MAVNSIGLHIVAVSIWVGGLAALFIIRGASGTQMPTLVRRYSSMALLAFGLVAISGLSAIAKRCSNGCTNRYWHSTSWKSLRTVC